MSIQSLRMMFHSSVARSMIISLSGLMTRDCGRQSTKNKSKPFLEPRLYRRGLRGQPNQIIKTFLGQGDLANFTVDNIAETLRNHGYNRDFRQNGYGET